jgi:pyrimidine-nucleoside phosphorylase
LILPYRILDRKRAGMRLSEAEVLEIVRGATDGSWSDAQLGAFLMAAAIRGLDVEETRALTLGMLESGERWHLARDVPNLCDKHSTGGIGDKTSLVLPFLLASRGLPVSMLAGRGLGHSGGTMDKLEAIPGMDLDLDRRRCLDLLERCGVAFGGATGGIAPADRRLYSLRDVTATVESLPLITASILSKKLAMGAAAVVFDVKAGNGAFMKDLESARELARMLVETAGGLGTKVSALITDMNQPLGRWCGNAAEVREGLDCLEGRGPADLMEVTYRLAEEVSALVGQPLTRVDLQSAIASGRARERFDQWAVLQGANPAWLLAPVLPLAPVERVLRARRSGVVASIDTRQLGMLLIEAGTGRIRPDSEIDHGVSLLVEARLGDEVREGQELGRLHLRRDDDGLVERFAACFEVGESGEAPALVPERIG